MPRKLIEYTVHDTRSLSSSPIATVRARNPVEALVSVAQSVYGFRCAPTHWEVRGPANDPAVKKASGK